MNISDAGGLSLETVGIASTISREEFEHLSLRWYVNGGIQGRFVEYEWRQYPTIGQRLMLTDPDSEVPYEFTGRYEMALTVNLNEYLGDPDSTCQALYNSHLYWYPIEDIILLRTVCHFHGDLLMSFIFTYSI